MISIKVGFVSLKNYIFNILKELNTNNFMFVKMILLESIITFDVLFALTF